MDCIKKMREFILENAIAKEEDLLKIEEEAKQLVLESKKSSWEKFIQPIRQQVQQATNLCNQIVFEGNSNAETIASYVKELNSIKEPLRRDVMKTLAKVIHVAGNSAAAQPVTEFYHHLKEDANEKYSSVLHSVSEYRAGNIAEVKPAYGNEDIYLNGFEILNKFFDQTLTNNHKVFAFGEDVGNIGDVNQGFAGLQEKHGKWRVFDAGIREATIMGQGIGMALRGLRPIAEIQYLDYLLYGLQALSDDVATLQWRTKGGQKCPLIVRTRGHRLEGVWHSGSPMGMMIHALRGINICVPRNMVQAAGMYNTLLQADEPAIVGGWGFMNCWSPTKRSVS
jgi:hypothetical protein